MVLYTDGITEAAKPVKNMDRTALPKGFWTGLIYRPMSLSTTSARE